MDFARSGFPTPFLGVGQGFEGGQQQRRSQSPAYGVRNMEMNHHDEEAQISEMGQAAPPYTVNPVFNQPDDTLTTPQEVGYTGDGQTWPYKDPFDFPGGEGVLHDPTSEPSHWTLWDPTNDSHNYRVSEMISGPLMVNSEEFDDFNADVDEAGLSATSQDANSMPHTYDPGLDVLLPDQPQRQAPLFGNDSTVDYTGWGLFPRHTHMEPQSPAFPVVRWQQERKAEGRGAIGLCLAPASSAGAFRDPTTHHIGQHQLEGQPSEPNTEQLTLLKCPDCGNFFRDAPGLRKHNNIHTGKDRRFACGVAGCGLTFRWPKDLRKHNLTHNKPLIPPWPCPEDGCHKGYIRRDHLLRHLGKNHADSPTAVEVLMTSAALHRRTRLVQPSGSGGKKSRKEGAAEVSAAEVSSHAGGTQTSASREMLTGPALPPQTSSSSLAPNCMSYGAAASTTSYDPSLSTFETWDMMSNFSDPAFSAELQSFYSAPQV